jgi:hypothetical protein
VFASLVGPARVDFPGSGGLCSRANPSTAPAQQVKPRLAELEAEMAACQSLLMEARTLGDDIRAARDNVLKTRLLGRGPIIWSVTLVNLQQAGTLPGAVQAFFLDRLQVKNLRISNWMLRDPRGRVIVPVGVAYGSDVEKVREVLLQAARQHPLVIADDAGVSPPRVLFRGFGDSSPDFEVRLFIRNVDQRLVTVSELNFAIEKGLREASIEIPFPQRDLHLRSVDDDVSFGPPPT